VCLSLFLENEYAKALLTHVEFSKRLLPAVYTCAASPAHLAP
jgi:hypothetical protein